MTNEDTPSAPVAPAAAPTDTAPTATPAADDDAAPDWLPLAALAGLAALLGGGWLWWRARRASAEGARRDEDIVAPPPPAVRSDPAPRPPVAPVAAKIPTPAAPSPLGRRADLHLAFEPLSAQSTLINLRLGYAVTVRNTGVIAAEPLTLRIGLFAGSQAHPQGIANWFETNDVPPHHGLPSLAPGEEHRFEGELAAPLDALAPLTIDGRVLVVPLIALDARYGHGPGEAPIEGQAAHAFVVGRDPGAGNAKLAPFRLDQGPTVFAPLGQRDTGIGKVA